MVLNFFIILIYEILVREFMNTKVSENLNCMFSKAIEYLEK